MKAAHLQFWSHMVKNKSNILLVEDEPNFGTVLMSYLKLAEYEVQWVKNGKEAYSIFMNNHFDLCILDVMMPEMDGFSLGKEIKKAKPELPFIYLTAKGMKEDVLKGFKLGAEDYLTKPFDSDILLEKIKVVLSRNQNKKPNKPINDIVEIGKYLFKPLQRKLFFGEEVKKLSPKESALLAELLEFKNSVMPRSHALDKIWEENNYFTTRSMDVYIAKLRKYLEKDQNIKIENIHGNGFQLNVEDQ